MNDLLQKIRACEVCKNDLKDGVNPVLSVGIESRILIIGQAPGSIVHRTGIPWNDQSGENLRRWMGIDKEIFYNTNLISIMPMGFCYPGRGKSGDLPPRPECAPLWHSTVLEHLPDVKLTLLIGQYAQHYYLQAEAKKTLTETVRNFEHYLPRFFPLPHPSPRNNMWQKKNEWFVRDVIPVLQGTIKEILS